MAHDRLYVVQSHNGRAWVPLLWAHHAEFAMHATVQAMRAGARCRWYEVTARHRVRMSGAERVWLSERDDRRRARGL